ncbi:MAG: hypothetical protein H7282_17070 [Cytophagaceae bacterium]|nr:hypothetical protein [Cytophagaceae bacterium]
MKQMPAMTVEQFKFHYIFSSKGGLFNVAHLEELQHFKTAIEQMFEVIKKKYPNLPPINFDFVLNDSLNACVKKVNGEYYIGINIGAYFLLKDMFQKMLSSNKVLLNVGNPLIETGDKNLLTALNNRPIEFDIANIEMIVPKDPVRTSYGSLYMTFCLNFLVLHECAHIIRGHLDYHIKSNHNSDWNEFEDLNPQTNLESCSLYQTLEMDADSFATNWAFIEAESIIEHNLPPIKNDTSVFENWNSFVFNWFFSIYSLLRMQGFNELNVSKCKSYTHPPATIRMALIAGNIISILEKKNKNDSIDEITKNYIASSKEAEKAYMEITCSHDCFGHFAEIYKNTDLQNYNSEILSNWNKVRPLL